MNKTWHTTPIIMLLTPCIASAHEPRASAGFAIGTIVIHMLGLLVGMKANKRKRSTLLMRYLGACITSIGVYLIIH